MIIKILNIQLRLIFDKVNFLIGKIMLGQITLNVIDVDFIEKKKRILFYFININNVPSGWVAP